MDLFLLLSTMLGPKILIFSKFFKDIKSVKILLSNLMSGFNIQKYFVLQNLNALLWLSPKPLTDLLKIQ